ncbi:MAG TPA: alpha/beta hydrolase [Rhizomicrobium sp.]|jgi:alpha-beta hydrolase superfamily lysophospholipase|nr:alpha/beta hydrolase [Rhizomicrobium sp.]
MTIRDHAFTFNGADGERIAAWRWSGDAPVRGVLQIAHGMGEHALRYREPLIPIIESGIVVYANDHRGHGRTAKSKEALGDFGTGGFPALPADMAILSVIARAGNADKKLILLGHSMGSFALQLYLLDHSALIDGAILSGSAALDLLAQASDLSGGLESFNAAFEPARTPFDWLSRDEKEVDKYIADPLCGFSVNAESQASMFGALMRAMDPAALKAIRADLPIHLIAGDRDPVNGNLKFLTPLADRYRAAGVRDVTTKFYKDGRHEMLNETNREEVVSDLKAWMGGVVSL